MIYIGIDPGRDTGVAVWDSVAGRLLLVKTMSITRAIHEVECLAERCGKGCVMLIFEDARQRKWFGERSEFKQQGAGSVKRDCVIWETFCREQGIRFRAVPPVRGGTKVDKCRFKAVTGWTSKTSEHGRDAAILVFGR